LEPAVSAVYWGAHGVANVSAEDGGHQRSGLPRSPSPRLY